MAAIGGVGGAGSPNLPPPSTGKDGEDPFEGEDVESTQGFGNSGEAASGGGSDTLDLSSALRSGEGESALGSEAAAEAAEDGEGAPSYAANGGLEGLDGGGEVDAMI